MSRRIMPCLEQDSQSRLYRRDLRSITVHGFPDTMPVPQLCWRHQQFSICPHILLSRPACHRFLWESGQACKPVGSQAGVYCGGSQALIADASLLAFLKAAVCSIAERRRCKPCYRMPSSYSKFMWPFLAKMSSDTDCSTGSASHWAGVS